MEWFQFLSDLSNTLEPYVVLIILSIWFSFNAKKEGHFLSRVSFVESFVGFLVVIIVISIYKIGFIATENYYFSVFLSAVGVLWGSQGLIWGTVFWIFPIEKIFNIETKKNKKS